MAAAPLNWLAKIGSAVLNTRHSTLISDAINEINREVNKTTTFEPTGEITETYVDGFEKQTTFDSETQITERYYKDDVLYSTKVTQFNSDGSITETYL